MKRCPYCGKEYSDEYSVCAIDESSLESCDPKPPKLHGAIAASKTTGQHIKAVWISGTCVIASVAFYLILLPGGSGTLGLAAILGCLTAVKVILLASDIAFVIQGFRVHWGWGTANMFLGPLAGIPFFIQHRHEGRVPIYILAHSFILLLVVLICLILYKAVS